MTDKVQKIRNKVEKLRKSYQIMYQELDCESPELMSVCAKRNLCQDILMFIDSLQEEPVSDDLEDAADKYSQSIHSDYFNDMFDRGDIYEAVIYGAEWKEQQFEKNRLAACDRQTEKEADIERDFVMGIIEKEHRQPTFDDAIKYGMTLQKAQMIKSVLDADKEVADEGKEE